MTSAWLLIIGCIVSGLLWVSTSVLLAQVPGPLPPPTALPGTVANCAVVAGPPPGFTCDVAFDLTGQTPGVTWSIGGLATDGAGVTGSMVPALAFTTDAGPPVVSVSNCRQSSQTINCRITAVDPSGIVQGSITAVATRP